MKVYLAAPLFTVAERALNEHLARAVEKACPFIQMVLPQRRASALARSSSFPKAMFEYCVNAIKSCEIVVAILDGPDADSGTCVEVGYAKAIGKRVLGIRTDLRASEDRGLNLMVANICDDLILLACLTASVDDLASAVASRLASFSRDSSEQPS